MIVKIDPDIWFITLLVVAYLVFAALIFFNFGMEVFDEVRDAASIF